MPKKKTRGVGIKVSQKQFNRTLSVLSRLSGGLPVPVHDTNTGKVEYLDPKAIKARIKKM